MNTILKLSEYVKNNNLLLNEIKEYFNYLYPKDDMDNLGLKLQIIDKGPNGSKPNYVHGYIISSALHKYINDSNENNIIVFETGTARGFSSLVMAKVLELNNKMGEIHTIDLLNHNTNTFKNCYRAYELKRPVTREECLEEWTETVYKYIKYHSGDSNEVISKLKLDRIHFAFLDGHHDYNYVKNELNYVSSKQKKGDVIICDDYTKIQMDSICKAIDEFIEKDEYSVKIFYCKHGVNGEFNRGYVYLKKI